MSALRRLALFAPSLAGGGAERVVLLLANGFADRGVQVDLVLACSTGSYLGLVDPRVQVHDLGARRILTSFPALVRYLKRRRPDGIISALSHANVIATAATVFASPQARTRLIVTEHVQHSAEAKYAPSWHLTLQRWLMRVAYRHVYRVVAVSAGVASDLSQALALPPDSVTAIHNPIVTDELLHHCKGPAPHPWFEVADRPVILGVGRLTSQKDFLTLVEAFALLRQRRPARLVILGEGERRAHIEAAVAARNLEHDVLLPGFVDNPYAWMSHAKVFVLSSTFEGFGNVLVEAMATGTPVVSTDCDSGPAEILEGGRWGRLVPVGDVGAMSLAIAATLDDPSHPDVVRRSREFTVRRAVDRYLNLFEPTL